jgi:hypothetical protein
MTESHLPLTDDQGLVVLDDEECKELLGQGWLGRIGLIIGTAPAIFPVNYRFSDDAIFFRTGPGVKLEAARRGDVMAFEVDEVDRVNEEGWSVLLVGPSSVVTDDAVLEGAPVPVRPWAPGQRDHLVRIEVSFVSGRRITQHADPETG